MRRWTAIPAAINEISCRMGTSDPNLAALPTAVVGKLYLVHCIVVAAAAQEEHT